VKKAPIGLAGVKRAFDASGLRLSEFAKRVGVPLSTAHGWVNCTHGVKHHRLPKIAKALKTTIAELIA